MLFVYLSGIKNFDYGKDTSICSNLGTRIQLTLSAETDDLRQLVADALIKIGQYGSSQETFLV